MTQWLRVCALGLGGSLKKQVKLVALPRNHLNLLNKRGRPHLRAASFVCGELQNSCEITEQVDFLVDGVDRGPYRRCGSKQRFSLLD